MLPQSGADGRGTTKLRRSSRQEQMNSLWCEPKLHQKPDFVRVEAAPQEEEGIPQAFA